MSQKPKEPTFHYNLHNSEIVVKVGKLVIGKYFYLTQPVKYPNGNYHFYFEFYPTNEIGFTRTSWEAEDILLRNWMLYTVTYLTE